MSDRVFCIDFGSAYTKVALRRNPRERSELVHDPSLSLDDGLNVCIPTVLVVDTNTPAYSTTWGMSAANDPASGDGLKVWRNWKKELYEATPTTRPPGVSRLAAFLKSTELRELAGRHEISGDQIDRLRQLVAAAAGLDGPAAGVTPEYRKAAWMQFLANSFFTHLRAFVLAACRREGVEDADRIPVRITVPAFADQQGYSASYGCRILNAALKAAGWSPCESRTAVSEPYANAIGILTRAANEFQSNGRLYFKKMFHNGPLVTALAQPDDYPAYRALVVDVGAFTTDFAAITIQTGGEIVSDPDPSFVHADQSIPEGVGNLDSEVIEALPREKGRWLREVATMLDWEDIHRNVFTGVKGFRSNEIGTIGLGPEKSLIRDCVNGFTARLSDRLTAFCGGLEPVPFQELILTGGGNGIPAVRESLLKAARARGHGFRKIHTMGRKGTEEGESLLSTLDRSLARGGSALGGASIYFESAYS